MKKANEIKKIVADNLKKYRREKGMTQKELADEINKVPKECFLEFFQVKKRVYFKVWCLL